MFIHRQSVTCEVLPPDNFISNLSLCFDYQQMPAWSTATGSLSLTHITSTLCKESRYSCNKTICIWGTRTSELHECWRESGCQDVGSLKLPKVNSLTENLQLQKNAETICTKIRLARETKLWVLKEKKKKWGQRVDEWHFLVLLYTGNLNQATWTVPKENQINRSSSCSLYEHIPALISFVRSVYCSISEPSWDKMCKPGWRMENTPWEFAACRLRPVGQGGVTEILPPWRTPGLSCDWLGPQPDSMQFVA